MGRTRAHLTLLVVLSACTTTAPPGAPSATDADGDGVYADRDCNDHDAGVSPDSPEHCDGQDDDCDGLVDEDDAVDAVLRHYDRDHDGYGSPTPWMTCDATGGVDDASDCDDADRGVHPGAVDRCNGIDDDCDGDFDFDGQGPYLYADSDTDGFGDPASGRVRCDGVGVNDSTDCDDSDYHFHPGAPEEPNQGDTNCDGFALEARLGGTWVADTADLTVVGEHVLDSLWVPTQAIADVDMDGQADLVLATPRAPDPRLHWLPGPIAADFDLHGNEIALGGGITGALDCLGVIDFDSAPGRQIVTCALAQTTDEAHLRSGLVSIFDAPLPGSYLADDVARWRFEGYPNTDPWNGTMLSSWPAGDVDGDGLEDLVLGTDPYTTEYPMALVLGGLSEGNHTIDDADFRWSDEYAHAIHPVGDVNGDGIGDFIDGRSNSVNHGEYVSTAVLWTGRTGASPVEAAVWEAEEINGTLGLEAARCGDVTGDQTDDLLLTDSEFGRTFLGAIGKVYLYDTASLEGRIDHGAAVATITGNIGEGFGRAARCGDLNDDGFADIAVGAWARLDRAMPTDQRGAAYVYYGNPSFGRDQFVDDASMSIYPRLGGDEDSMLGWFLDIGDVSGDGVDDLVVASPTGMPDDSSGGLILRGNMRIFTGGAGR